MILEAISIGRNPPREVNVLIGLIHHVRSSRQRVWLAHPDGHAFFGYGEPLVDAQGAQEIVDFKISRLQRVFPRRDGLA